MIRETTFEATVHRYSFAPLVDLGVALGRTLRRLLDGARRARPAQDTSIDTGLGHAA